MLIEKDRAKDYLLFRCTITGYGSLTPADISAAMDELEPARDRDKPKKWGRILVHGRDWHKCPVCDAQHEVDGVKWNYCRNCGQRLEEPDD